MLPLQKKGKKKILFTIGSLNQTTQMHQIAEHLPNYDCWFTQLYSNHYAIQFAMKRGWLEGTVLGYKSQQKATEYLRQHGLQSDYGGASFGKEYELAVLCSDMIVDRQLQKLKTVWVQEGMTDPLTTAGKLVHRLKLPPYLAMNTAFNGSSNKCDIYCAASEGYKKQFASLGTEARKIVVTGIPNYDDIKANLHNNFPERHYVLVATSDIREAYKKENREAFIQSCVKIAGGRKLIFKLHPNEIKERAIAEIKNGTPSGTLIFTEGNTAHMIANCDELITQYSTVVYTGIVLGKKVHSYFNLDDLYSKVPLQNGGTSAFNIAQLIQDYIEHKGSKESFEPNLAYQKPLLTLC